MEAIIVIESVFNITGLGAVPVGVVRSGTFMVGMQATIGGMPMTVKTIEMNHNQLREAPAGSKVGFSLEGGDLEALNSAVGQEIRFSGSGSPQQVSPEPIHPKGLWDSIKGLFKP